MLSYFQGNTYKDPISRINIITNEGPSAVHEAISFLKSCQQSPNVTLSKGLTQAARDHCYDIGPRGEVSHTGSDGSTMSERMERYGQWNRAIAENISFSEKTGKDIIIQFIIDDGNASRGHRKNLFNQDYLVVGIACGYHKGYEVCCVMDLASEYDDNLAKNTKSKPNISHNELGHRGDDRYQKSPGGNKYHNNRKSNTDNWFNNDDFFEKKKQHALTHLPLENHFHEDEDWPAGAVKVQVKKVTKTKGNKKITTTTKVFQMNDGSTKKQHNFKLQVMNLSLQNFLNFY